MGDFNTEIFHSDITKLLDECELVDLHEPHMDPRSTSTPNTHLRGSHKIDHIFGSDLFLHALHQGGMILSIANNIADHRILVVDLCQHKLQALNTDLTSLSHRLLNSKSPRKVKIYNDTVDKKMEEHKLLRRFYTLKQRCNQAGYTPTPRDQLKFYKLDTQMTEIMLHAENKCGKKMNAYQFSPALVKAGRKITALKKRCHFIIVTQLNVAGTAAEKINARTALNNAQNEVKNAWSHLGKVQKHSKQLSKLYLTDLATTAAMERNTTVETIINEMLQSAKNRRSWSKIRRYTREPHSGQIDRILLPDENMREVSDPDELQHHLIEASIADMNLPEGSPFTTAPLDTIIPPWDPSPVTEEILNGTYVPPDTSSREVKELFCQLKRDPTATAAPGTLQVEITLDQLRQAIKIRKESTASSPSG
jgi:hypothetical protein